MIAGWVGVLLLTFLLAVTAPAIGSTGWILLSVGTMFFLMLAGTSSRLNVVVIDDVSIAGVAIAAVAAIAIAALLLLLLLL